MTISSLISFKNVGLKKWQTETDLLVRSPKPIGIKTPIEYGRQGEGIFHMHFDIANQIQDNFRNLLLTNHGERLGLYDFGANLHPLVSEFLNKDDFDSEAASRIKTAVNIYMPFVSLVGFKSELDYENNKFIGKVNLLVVYSVPDINVLDKTLTVILSVM